jgi:hypothetical protein
VRKALVTAAIVVISVSACSGSGSRRLPSPVAACKHALEKQLSATLRKNEVGKGPEPAACKALSARTFNKLRVEVYMQWTGMPSGSPSPARSASGLSAGGG